ncbi:MAG: hypothetical protein IIC93_06460, partial [Chloroflexi bacterium]|nr:hypothetical protein [Chloroflexota bacterium]
MKRSGENSGRFGWLRKRSFIGIAATAAIMACTPGASGIDSADALEAYGIDPAIVHQFMENGGKLPAGYEAKLEMLTESQAFADLVADSGASTRTNDNNFTMPKGAVQGDSEIVVLIRVAADLGVLSDSVQQAFVMASVQPTPTAPAVVMAIAPADDGGNDFFDSASALARPSDPSPGDPADDDSFADAPVIVSAMQLPPKSPSNSDDADTSGNVSTDIVSALINDAGAAPSDPPDDDQNNGNSGESDFIVWTVFGDDSQDDDESSSNSGNSGKGNGESGIVVSTDFGDDSPDDEDSSSNSGNSGKGNVKSG